MSLALQIFTSLLVAFFLTTACLRVLMRRRPKSPSGGVRNGPWLVDLSVGSKAAGLYMRALVARRSTFALSAPETVYFATTRDSAGQDLRAGATYAIAGRDLDARWWSITAYKHRHLIPNVLNRYSFSKTTVTRKADGSWRI